MSQKSTAAMSNAGFVHLHVHSAYSLLKGSIKIQKLAELAKADRQPALALTDTDNMFGALEFSDKMAACGIQPIIGCELAVDFGDQDPNARNALAAGPARIVLLAARERGYRSLMRLNSRAFLETPIHQAPHIKFEWLQGDAEDLIALTGGPDGPISLAINADHAGLAAARCDRLASLFGDRLYIELQRHGIVRERRTEAGLIDLAYAKGLPLVATNEPYFATTDDYEAHDALLCIAGGRLIAETDRDQLTPDHRFKTRAEMAVLVADVPEALASTIETAGRCSFRPTTRKPILPRFTVGAAANAADAESDGAAELRAQAEEGLSNRLKVHGLSRGASEEDYRARLAFEIDVITRMNYAGYFLIVADFIQWAKAEGIPVGPGRGSGAGSLVAYALTITDLDPIQFGLLFERFLNPERVSMPDFDIDFCQDGRDRVIDYVKLKYGAESVSQIVTFGTMAAKAVVRDVGRVLDLPYTFCDGIAKLIPFQPGRMVTLKRRQRDAEAQANVVYAREVEPLLNEREAAEEEVRELLSLAEQLEGIARNVGMHAGGVLIAPGKLTDFCPLYTQAGSDAPVSQFDKDDVELVGLVKFDFLGLTTLTILDWALRYIRKLDPASTVALETLPLDDKATYDIFKNGNTTGVFQFESRGMRELLLQAPPKRFDDVIALVALYRPGPMELIPDYVRRKQGAERFEYHDARLEPILAPTYGVMVYQEQVMQIAQVIGGYTLGAADLLRRARGKKLPDERAKHRQGFVSGAIDRGLSSAKAMQLFDHMEKFAGYGFNKSHAAAYALIAYQTAYFKAHHPSAFMAANLSLVMDDTDKVRQFYVDALALGLEMLPPDVNASSYRFEPVDERRVRYGLGGIKGTGRAAIEAIVAARDKGPFIDLFDFCCRVDKRC